MVQETTAVVAGSEEQNPMRITLSPRLEAMVKQKLETGRYSGLAEVIEEALYLLDERDRLQEIDAERLRQEVAIGLKQLDQGQGIPGEQVFEELREKSRQLIGDRPDHQRLS